MVVLNTSKDEEDPIKNDTPEANLTYLAPPCHHPIQIFKGGKLLIGTPVILEHGIGPTNW